MRHLNEYLARNFLYEFAVNRLAAAERSSALQRAILALLMPTHKRHLASAELAQGFRPTRRMA
jgi:hypothetical protein